MTKLKIQSRSHQGKAPCEPQLLRTLLDADYDRGTLTWRQRPEESFATLRAARIWNVRFAGRPVKPQIDRDGYERFKLLNRTVALHRVMFAHCHGRWPKETIDHINGVKNDNRISNLRDMSNLENNLKRGQTGRFPRGVKRSPNGKRFVATMGKNGNAKHLGTFDTLEEAVNARRNEFIRMGVTL